MKNPVDRNGDGFVVPLAVQGLLLFFQIIIDYLIRIWPMLKQKGEEESE